MSCLSSLFGCCLPINSSSTSTSPTTETTQITSLSNNTNNPDLIPPPGPDNGYESHVPLPRYTPRPMSIQEKTLEAHMRDPPISSAQYYQHSIDEKQRLAWEERLSSPDYYPRPEEVTSDVSSAISFPSSYGNTSTATRETPPPPYSPPTLSPAPSRSMSISSIYPPPMMSIAPPPPVFQRPEALSAGSRVHARDSGCGSQFMPSRQSIDEQLASHPRRFSWESR